MWQGPAQQEHLTFGSWLSWSRVDRMVDSQHGGACERACCEGAGLVKSYGGAPH